MNLTTTAWRHRPYSYASALALGREAIVLEESPTGVRYLSYDFARAFVAFAPLNSFLQIYSPDLTLTATEAAGLIAGFVRTMLSRTDQETVAALAKFRARKEPAMKLKNAPAKAGPVAHCYADAMRRTALVVMRDADYVTLVRYSENYEGSTNGGSVELVTMDEAAFKERYVMPIDGYPVDRAAALFAQAATHLGATHEAMAVLGKLTPVTREASATATAKFALRAPVEPKPLKAAAKPARAAKSSVSGPRGRETLQPAAKPPKKIEVAVPGPGRTTVLKKLTAAARFRELILAGKLSDDQIFAAVQKEFDLADERRSYVDWYRKDLTKKGLLK